MAQVQRTGQQHLLLVAATEVAHGRPRAAALDLQLADEPLRGTALARLVEDQPPSCVVVDMAEREVLGDGEARDERVLALRRNQDDAVPGGGLHIARQHGSPVHAHRAGARRREPGDQMRNRGPTRAHQSGERDDLAVADRERRRDVEARPIEPVDTHADGHVLADAGAGAPVSVGMPAEQAHEVRTRQRGPRHRGDDLAVTQDGDRVRDAHDLVESVADQEGGDALGLAAQDQVEQVVAVRVSQRRRRLVQHDDARVVTHRPCERDELLVRRV
ncbi:MAG: hypothetical protein U0S48_10280 [Solirubrobacteraceae bacterium]